MRELPPKPEYRIDDDGVIILDEEDSEPEQWPEALHSRLGVAGLGMPPIPNPIREFVRASAEFPPARPDLGVQKAGVLKLTDKLGRPLPAKIRRRRIARAQKRINGKFSQDE